MKRMMLLAVFLLCGCQGGGDNQLRPASADASLLRPYLAAADTQAEQLIKEYDEPAKGKKPEQPVYFADYDRTVQEGTWRGRAVVVVTYLKHATAAKEAPAHFTVWVDKTTRQADVYDQ